jgi:hypothetical protein
MGESLSSQAPARCDGIWPEFRLRQKTGIRARASPRTPTTATQVLAKHAMCSLIAFARLGCDDMPPFLGHLALGPLDIRQVRRIDSRLLRRILADAGIGFKAGKLEASLDSPDAERCPMGTNCSTLARQDGRPWPVGRRQSPIR